MNGESLPATGQLAPWRGHRLDQTGGMAKHHPIPPAGVHYKTFAVGSGLPLATRFLQDILNHLDCGLLALSCHALLHQLDEEIRRLLLSFFDGFSKRPNRFSGVALALKSLQRNDHGEVSFHHLSSQFADLLCLVHDDICKRSVSEAVFKTRRRFSAERTVAFGGRGHQPILQITRKAEICLYIFRGHAPLSPSRVLACKQAKCYIAT